MKQYLLWYANLHKFYRIILLAAMGVGVVALGSGMATENPVMFVVGLFWLVATPAIVHVASSFEDR